MKKLSNFWNFIVLIAILLCSQICGMSLSSFVDEHGKQCFSKGIQPTFYGCNKHHCGTIGSVILWKINNTVYAAKKYHKKNIDGFKQELYVNIKIKDHNIKGIPKYMCHSMKHQIILMEAIFGFTSDYYFSDRANNLYQLYDGILQLSDIVNELHGINVYYIDWKLSDIMFDRYDNLYLIDFGFSETINPETNYWFQNKWIGKMRYWGNGFRYFSYFQNIQKVQLLTNWMRNYAIKGDKFSMAKIIVYWISIFCECNNNIRKKYTYFCRRIENYLNQIDFRINKLHIIQAAITEMELNQQKYNDKYRKLKWKELIKEGHLVDTALQDMITNANMDAFNGDIDVDIFEILSSLVNDKPMLLSVTI